MNYMTEYMKENFSATALCQDLAMTLHLSFPTIYQILSIF